MATHSSIVTLRIPWTEEPGELQSIGSQSRTRLKQLCVHPRSVKSNFISQNRATDGFCGPHSCAPCPQQDFKTLPLLTSSPPPSWFPSCLTRLPWKTFLNKILAILCLLGLLSG